MKNVVLSFVAVIALLPLLNGCISINSNGYNMLTAEQLQHVVRPSRPLDELTLCDTIYIINDNDVREFVKDKDTVIVCHFLTWCTSEYCITPAAEHALLTGTGLPFLMIAGDFYSTVGYNADYPYITIDSKYYKTGRYNRAMKRMFQALGCGDNWWHSYLIFCRGELVSTGRTLDEALGQARGN